MRSLGVFDDSLDPSDKEEDEVATLDSLEEAIDDSSKDE